MGQGRVLWYALPVGKLTVTQVKALKEPGRYADGGGLYLRISPTGSKSWMLRTQVDGARRDLGLGSVNARSLAEAREAAIDLRRQYQSGVALLPPEPKRRESMPTFRDAALAVHAERIESWKNGKHQAQWLATLESYVFPYLGSMPVDAIEGPAIRTVLAKIWLAKPETARRVRQRIATVLDWSCAKGYRISEAPMRSLSKALPRQPKKTGHFEAMPYTEVPAFLAAIRQGRPSMGRLALEAAILTAARSGEVRGARWGEVDLEAALWIVPADRMKAGVKHLVPLSDAAMAVFNAAATYRMPCTDLVFPGQKPKQPLSAMTLLKVIRDMSGGVTVHGFRSSFRDWVAEETNYPGEVAEAALAHTIPNKVEAAYRRTDFLAKRRAMMADWAAFCGG